MNRWHTRLLLAGLALGFRKLLIGILLCTATGNLSAAWPELGELTDVVFANHRFVAVGPSGKLLWSTDGASWTKSSYSGQENFRAVIHNGLQFVAVAADGTLARSANGSTWSVLGRPEFEGFPTDLAYGRGIYVLVDDFGYIYASRDGVTWTTEFKPGATVDEELYGVAYAGNSFVAVGIHYDRDFDSYGLIRRSTTGFSWTRERQKVNEELYGVSYADGLFWATGVRYDSDFNSFSQVLSSATGATWTQVTVPGEETLYGLASGNNILVAGGDNGIVTLREGTVWSQRWSGSPTGMIAAVAYGNDTFVAVGKTGLECVSADGLAWFGKQPKPSLDLSSIAAGSVLLIGGAGGLWISEDQRHWANTYYGDVRIEEVIYNNGLFLAVGNRYDFILDRDMGVILRSTSGRSWERVRQQANEQLFGVAYGKGLYVAVGYRESGLLLDDLILTSPEGRHWTSRSPGTGADGMGLNAVAYASGRFVAVGDAGTVMTSPGGLAWNPVETEFPEDLHDLAYGQNQIVAVGDKGKLLVSSDAVNWIEKSTGRPQSLKSAAFQNDTFFGVGVGGLILQSTDLTSWSHLASGVTNALNDLLLWRDQILVVGEQGTILDLPLAKAEPAYLRLARKGASYELLVRGRPGSTYGLEFSDGLGLNPAWIFSQSMQLDGEGTATLALPGDLPYRFYRCFAE